MSVFIHDKRFCARFSAVIIFLLFIGLVEEFRSVLDQHPDGMSDAVAAIKVLLETIKRSEGSYSVCEINNDMGKPQRSAVFSL